MAYAHMFYGDYRRSENPRAFLYDFEEHLATLPDVSESRKCEHFYLNCRSGFGAEEWYENFEQNSPSVITSWSTLRKHFCVKWLGASPNILLEIPNTKPVATIHPSAATTISHEMTTTTTSTVTPTPTNTTATAIYETTTTSEQLNCVADTRHVIATPTPIPTTTATATDPNNAMAMADQQDNEGPAVGREEERKKGEKQDETSEQEAEQHELGTGEQEGIDETQGEIRDCAVLNTMTLHEPMRFDWAAEVDKAFGLSPFVRNITQPVSDTPYPMPIKPVPRDVTVDPVRTKPANVALYSPIVFDNGTVVHGDKNAHVYDSISPVDPDPGDVANTIGIALTTTAPSNPVSIELASNAPIFTNTIDYDPGDVSAGPTHVVLDNAIPIEPINTVPVDPDPIRIAFASAILIDPDPGDARTAHAAHVNPVCIDPDLVISTSSIQQLSLLLLVLSTFFSHYFHSLDSNFHIRIFSFGLLKDILGIGDADVTIWRGVDGVVDSGLEECQGSHQGYGVLPDISLSSRCS